MLLLADCHVHSSVSFDSEVSKINMVENAISKGFDYLCFTDHYDLLSPIGIPQTKFDWSVAQKTQNDVLKVYGKEIEIGFGIELGSAYINPAVVNSFTAYNLDFILGSIHNTTSLFKCVDYSRIDYSNQDVYRILKIYFEQILNLIQWGKFDSLAHIFYPLRYMKRDNRKVDIIVFDKEIRQLLKLLIDNNIALEINTKDLLLNYSEYKYLLNIYKDLGGFLITCGSDAHVEKDFGKNITKAYVMLLQKGFSYFTVFKNRMNVMLPLK